MVQLHGFYCLLLFFDIHLLQQSVKSWHKRYHYFWFLCHLHRNSFSLRAAYEEAKQDYPKKLWLPFHLHWSCCLCVLVPLICHVHCSISTILFSLWNLFAIIMAIIFLVLAFNNIFVIVFHPAFSKKEIKLYDDPTMVYSSGDNVSLLSGDET